MIRKRKADLYQQHESFTTTVHDGVAVLNFVSSPMLHSTDLSARDELNDYLDVVAASEQIKVLVLFGYPDKKGREEYIAFIRNAVESRTEQSRILRMCNIYNQFILKIVNFPKFVICVDSGRIITQYINVGLASDYRIVSDDTVFEKAYLDVGTIPKGGCAYFMMKILGRKKAMEVLLTEVDITARDALDLGLVDMVAPKQDLESVALETAEVFAAKPVATLYGVKKLLNFSIRDLKEYLDYENLELMRIVSCADFGKGFGCV